MTAPVTVLLGATGGVGAATARLLAARGHRLHLLGRDADRLAALAAEVGAAGTAVVDARDVDAVGTAVEAVATAEGRLDGAASVVGSLLLKAAHQTSAEEWAEVLAVNLTSAFALLRAAAPRMRGTGGSIVLTSTAVVRTGMANHEAIAAAKGGVEGMVRTAAATYGGTGVRVNAVAPGLTRTPLTARITANEAQAAASAQLHVLGRIGEPEDVAGALAWLLDPATTWVTGQVLGVDGGLGSARPRARA
jgi:3-oxoacyl-[acyl-carrier protein] reductase